jgi:hypothetical protein
LNSRPPHTDAVKKCDGEFTRIGRAVADGLTTKARPLFSIIEAAKQPDILAVSIVESPLNVALGLSMDRALGAESAQMAEDGAAMKAASRIVQIFLAIGTVSSIFREYARMPSEQVRRTWLLQLRDHLADFDARGTGAAAATWLRWSRWCTERGLEPREVKSFLTVAFLRTVGESGKPQQEEFGTSCVSWSCISERRLVLLSS